MAIKTTTLSPVVLGMQPSFGFGDRLGCATEGHVAALRAVAGPIRGIFAQQSIREMTRTQRRPHQVMHDAQQAIERVRFADGWSADADHLKNEADIRDTMDAGFVFFTLDPSDMVNRSADRMNVEQINDAFMLLSDQHPWWKDYLGRTISLDHGSLVFSEERLRRGVVKYARAIQRTIELAKFVEREGTTRGMAYELELSIDETEEPTTAEEHYLIADQLRRNDVRIVSLAPRLIGDFEKGIDYRGDLSQLATSLDLHAEIAQRLGPYKLSLHSGSDKLSIYPLLSKSTQGRFHVKTAGTSYLEGLRVICHQDEQLFRRLIDFARGRYETDRATYHVSASLDTIPGTSGLDRNGLEKMYLDRWEDVPAGSGFRALGRQILHCTFGSVLTDPELGPAVREVIRRQVDLYHEFLKEHFMRHLVALRY